jgi:uncharacterized protein YqhQ
MNIQVHKLHGIYRQAETSTAQERFFTMELFIVFTIIISMPNCVFRIIEFMGFFHRPIKTKANRLKLLRFESGFCFRLQVNNKKWGGGVVG